ncbi:bifunctional 2-polyprenyl-6-hydroxyphenol methylase/3-demethylubiquinol 3-O-methyltransferase UbiG [Bradyrhizobium sp. URHD0069]|uniref:class I SAM-dependent methyltransferase n=1 Tax=Bradyrhizobium sp. URHD0069 TaxID=1380355 RepID=UPI0009DCEC91|nr:class I SAM-dependent methyltransferase [Bradyrhizobium sp. URHD0069]
MTSKNNAGYRIEGESIYSNTEYLASNPTWHVEDSPWKAQKIYEILRRNNLKPSRIAEIGCGAGEILVQLKAHLPESSFVGYEMSEQAFALARSRERAGVRYVNANLLDEEVRFDALLCIDVFEHVDDYIGFIKSLKRYADYKIFHIPLDLSVQAVARVDALPEARRRVGHLHYFTKETALETIRYCGYEVIDANFTALAIEPPNRGLRANLMKIPRILLSKVAPDFAARVLGGWSLMVLAK